MNHRKNRLIILFLSLLSSVQAQNMISPLDIPLLLSGNFGELRHNHFHSGLDIKTGGRTGFPVKSVKEGYISRISVSPYGYGRAVYIKHPNGTTSVYGHLNSFVSRIATAVLDSQYRKESFSVDLHFIPNQFPVKQGEVFAYSGNTGGSAAPHLHFEIRETTTDKPIDPLPYLKDRIKDDLPPEIKGIRFFPQQGKGIVNGSSENQSVDLSKINANKTSSVIAKAWGKIGIGVKAYDRMSGTFNRYGVNEIQLNMDGEEIYHSVMNTFSFDNSRCLNTFIDWMEWIENNSFYMKSFVEQGNFLGANRSFRNGIIHIEEEKIYHLEYILKDIYGNTTRFAFDIVGEKEPIPPIPAYETFFAYNEDNEYFGKGVRLKIPKKNLYSNLYLNIDTISGYSPFAPLYQIGERIPLHSYCPVALNITNDIYPEKTKYGIVQLIKNKKNWIGGTYQAGQMSAQIRELGNFTVEIDTTPPTIVPVKPQKWQINQRIVFKITDDVSGIESYRCDLDEKFILFEYDAKTDSLFAIYKWQQMKKGKQTLQLVVTDKAGNKRVVNYKL